MDITSIGSGPKDDLLVGWKDIAVYLKCSVRKAQRLEQLNLPVKRIARTKSVWGSKREIDNWLMLQSESASIEGRGNARSSAPQVEVIEPDGFPAPNEYSRPLFSLARTGLLCVLLAATLSASLRSAYGLTIVLFAATLFFVIAMYRGLPESRYLRGTVVLFLLAGMAYTASATTLPEFTGSVVNMTTLRPAIAYPFVSGLRFIPIPALISTLLIVLAIDLNKQVVEGSEFRKVYLTCGIVLLSVTAIAGLSVSNAYRVWQAGLPIRWTLLAGESFIFAVNVALFIRGHRFWSARSVKSYREVLVWSGTGYLLIALTAAIVAHHWNEVDKYHLDIRRSYKYRVQNANAEGELRQWVQRHSAEVGPDFLALSEDPEFLRALRAEEFYRHECDEPFQLRNKAVIFGYRSREGVRDRRPFILIRFPAELAATLRFELARTR